MLLTEPSITVEDALEIARDNDIKKAVPFIKRLGPLALDLRSLSSSQLEKLKTEAKFKVDLKSLRSACEEILDKIEK